MGVVRIMVTTLFFSAWLMVHAVFLANLPPEEAVEKKLLPLQIRSGVSSAGRRGARLVSYSAYSSSASRAPPGAAAPPYRSEEDWLRPLSWAVTVMTMAEWLTFSYFLWHVLWLTILRPLVVVLFFIFLFLLGFYCVKGYYYALGILFYRATIHNSSRRNSALRGKGIAHMERPRAARSRSAAVSSIYTRRSSRAAATGQATAAVGKKATQRIHHDDHSCWNCRFSAKDANVFDRRPL